MEFFQVKKHQRHRFVEEGDEKSMGKWVIIEETGEEIITTDFSYLLLFI